MANPPGGVGTWFRLPPEPGEELFLPPAIENAEIGPMDETAPMDVHPSRLAYAVAHLLIGFLVGGITHLIFRQKVTVAIVAAVIAVAAHHNFDAPIARRLSEMGI